MCIVRRTAFPGRRVFLFHCRGRRPGKAVLRFIAGGDGLERPSYVLLQGETAWEGTGKAVLRFIGGDGLERPSYVSMQGVTAWKGAWKGRPAFSYGSRNPQPS